jgi:hypothetical protein
MAQQPRGIGDLSMLRRARRDLRDAEQVALAVAEPCGPLAGALLSSLPETVWVGMSAGSMVMTPRIGDDFVEFPSAPDDRTLGVVDFSIFPHLGHELMPENTTAAAERWAADIAGPAYAIDDQTAIKVTDGTVEVVSEGTGRYSPHSRGQQRSAWRSARSFYAAVSVRASGDADVCPPACTRLYGRPMASVRQFQVTFDRAEPERVARFWCEVLGYVVPPPPEGFATWDDFDRALPPERQGSVRCTYAR